MSESRLEAAFSGRLGDFAFEVKFNVPAQGVIGVYGPSGCGKTCLLRSLAGLQQISGRFSLGEDVLQDSAKGINLAPHRRRTGYVFQQANLFSHLSVRQNLEFGFQRLPVPEQTKLKQVGVFDEVVELLGLNSLLSRFPEKLSGGERQRVAIGRALLSAPKLLLLDEPLAGLDPERKDEILPYLEKLHHNQTIPMLYVTHDLAELERLADTLVLLRDGRCLAAGPLAQLLAQPDLWLMKRPEAAVVLEGKVDKLEAAYGLAQIELPGGCLHVPGQNLAAGTPIRVRLRASDVSLARTKHTDSSILNVFSSRITDVVAQDEAGNQLNVLLAMGNEGQGEVLIARVTRKSWERLGLQVGEQIYAQVKSVAVTAKAT